MKRILNNQNGFTTTFFAILIPVVLAFIGLCTDGVMILYYKISLDVATDSAAVSTIDSYDRNEWFEGGRIILRQDVAFQIAEDILHSNLPDARLIRLQINSSQPHVVSLDTEYDVKLLFLKIFGVDIKRVYTHSLAHGS